MLAPTLVDTHFFELLRIADAVPDEIVTAVTGPQIVVEPGDRIADDLLPPGQEEGEVGEDAGERRRRQVRLVGDAAPDVITGVDGLHFGRDGGAHGRAYAVAAVLVKVLEGVAQVIVPARNGFAQ